MKDAAHELDPPLMFLINKSFRTSTFSNREKIGKVLPIFKSGDQTSAENYRPISVLNILSKTVERTAYNQLMDYLEDNSLLNTQQFGFQRKKSSSHHTHGQYLKQHGSTNLLQVVCSKT